MSGKKLYCILFWTQNTNHRLFVWLHVNKCPTKDTSWQILKVKPSTLSPGALVQFREHTAEANKGGIAYKSLI